MADRPTPVDRSVALGVREVAIELGVHPHTVKRIPTTDLPFWRFGMRGDRRYWRTDVETYQRVRRER